MVETLRAKADASAEARVKVKASKSERPSWKEGVMSYDNPER